MNRLFTILISIAIIQSRKFNYFSYDDITGIFKQLNNTCSHYIKVTDSQTRYNLSASKCGNQDCKNLIVYLTDFSTYNIDKPHIYISGLLHGDEILGANTLTELALYYCDPLIDRTSISFNLLKERIFVFTPYTNAYGFYHGMREEEVISDNGKSLIDPNRDFPYFDSFSETNTNCMMSITARTVNELFREHIFVSSITFHGGLNAIGYPWGNFVHINSKESPDFNSFREIATILRNYTDSKIDNNIIPYEIDDMTHMSYAVEGGMEDWAYAGSWENRIERITKKPIKRCSPNTYSKYPEERTIYDEISARCSVYLVESAPSKKPLQDHLGTNENIFDYNREFKGHIPRNIRMIAAAADLMKPYVKINQIYNNALNITLLGCKIIGTLEIYSFPISENINELSENFRVFKEDNVSCFWNNFMNREDSNQIINIDLKNNYLALIKLTNVDNIWSNQISPEPLIKPQTHIVRLRSVSNYTVKNENYILNGNNYFLSNRIIKKDNITYEIDDNNAYLFNSNMVKANTIINNNFRIKAFYNFEKFANFTKTSEWLFRLNLSFIIQVNNEDSEENYQEYDNTILHILFKQINLDNVIIKNNNCNILKNPNGLIFRYVIKCDLDEFFTYNTLRNEIFPSIMHIYTKIDEYDFYIKNIFTLDDNLDGKFASSNKLKCLSDSSIKLLNDTNYDNEIIFEKINNFKWKIINHKSNITEIKSIFTDGGIYKKNDELFVNFKNLKIIGKNLEIIYTDVYSLNTTTNCTIVEDINFDFNSLEIPSKKIKSFNIFYIVIISILVLIIVIISICFYCVKKRKNTGNGFRLVSLSTGNSQIF